MRTLHRDIVLSMLVLLVSVTAGWVAFHYPSDSSWFPRVLTVFLGLMALFLLVRSLKTTGDVDMFDGQAAQARAAGIVFAAAILYALSIQFVSFEFANFLFLVVMMYVLGQRNPIVIACVATVAMLLIKLLFFVMLDVSRPPGLWF
ncbi:MAG: tripartite tricarboxylate transporter TctB family protein [Proteobacteria bacterium]|nr:tripartite tricarboxylate transporter TctB family protein [Pseudomonadota bacterium]